MRSAPERDPVAKSGDDGLLLSNRGCRLFAKQDRDDPYPAGRGLYGFLIGNLRVSIGLARRHFLGRLCCLFLSHLHPPDFVRVIDTIDKDYPLAMIDLVLEHAR